MRFVHDLIEEDGRHQFEGLLGVIERAALAVLNRLDPERAHGLALRALKIALCGICRGRCVSPRLEVSLGRSVLPNPIGLAGRGLTRMPRQSRP